MPRKKVLESDNVDDLNHLKIPITPIRFELAEKAKQGIEEYPVGDLILLIRRILRETKENKND